MAEAPAPLLAAAVNSAVPENRRGAPDDHSGDRCRRNSIADSPGAEKLRRSAAPEEAYSCAREPEEEWPGKNAPGE